MESYEQKKRRLLGRKYLKEYLNELSVLLQRKVSESELVSILESDCISNETAYLKRYLYYKEILDFSNKGRLKEILTKCELDFSVSYYLWISNSSNCGCMKLSSLTEFNFDFSYDDEHAGIIQLISANFDESILLDYYEENGNLYMNVEIYKI